MQTGSAIVLHASQSPFLCWYLWFYWETLLTKCCHNYHADRWQSPLLRRGMFMINTDKISFKKEGLPSWSECFNCFVRHLGTFVNDGHNWYTVSTSGSRGGGGAVATIAFMFIFVNLFCFYMSVDLLNKKYVMQKE